MKKEYQNRPKKANLLKFLRNFMSKLEKRMVRLTVCEALENPIWFEKLFKDGDRL
jgi:hypothetical protein